MKDYNSYIVSCEKASLLIEKKLGNALNPKEKTQLFIHKLICSICRKYEKQSKALDVLLRNKITNEQMGGSNLMLDQERIDQIKLLIDNKI